MKVHIKYAGTKQTIEVEGDTKLGELRTRAAALTGADASALRYLGKNLEDDAKTLTDCGIKNNRTVTCCAQFTMDEIAKHNTEADCWTAINGAVYDITDFIDEHPGGDIIMDAAGKDGTSSFENQAGQGSHTSFARTTLAKYYIGTLAA
jgi:cytochrome b involved in lipid metabolism